MELIIIIIIIAISVSKSKVRNGQSKRNNSSVDYGQYLSKAKEAARTLEASLSKTIETLDNGSSQSFSAKYRKTVKQRKQDAQTRQIEAARQQELEERKRREALEQRKRAEELRKKQEEDRRKQAEAARKKKEEQEMLRKFGVATAEVHEKEEESCKEICKDTCKELCEKPVAFRIEDYLDPLTASFYPGNKKDENKEEFNVDDYLFPTLAPYYPKTDTADLFETWK